MTLLLFPFNFQNKQQKNAGENATFSSGTLAMVAAMMRVVASSSGAPVVAMPGSVMMTGRMRVKMVIVMMMVRRRRAAPAAEAEKRRRQHNRYYPGAFHIHSLSTFHRKAENFRVFFRAAPAPVRYRR